MDDRSKIQEPPIDEPEGMRRGGASTDLPIVEESLLIKTERFQKIFDNASLAMIMIGRDGKFEYLNSGFTKLFGYGPEDVPDGRKWLKLAFPDPEHRKEAISAWKEDMKEPVRNENAAPDFHGPMQGWQQKDRSFQAGKAGHWRRFDDLRGYYRTQDCRNAVDSE